MEWIKYGSIEYFELVRFYEIISNPKYDKFADLDKLRFQLRSKIQALQPPKEVKS